MDPLAVGQVIDALYKVEHVIAESPRAHVYAVRHVRFPDVALALKLVPAEQSTDFERDTAALASLTTSAVAHVCDRGTLTDGRPYRVVSRLEGPTLMEAIATSTFGDDRSTQIIVGLAAVVFEAHANGFGPLDLSIENLMFAHGVGSQLCFLRALARDATDADPDADQAGLMVLRTALAREKASPTDWKPPSSIAEIKAATEEAGGPHTPPASEPGTKIGGWRVVRTISETLAATVYDVIGPNAVTGVLKIAGPLAERDRFEQDSKVLLEAISPHVVRVFETGTHDGTPFFVMDLLEGLTLEARLRTNGPFSVDTALVVVGQMLAAAEAIASAGGGPADFALEHCYATENPWRVTLTHATTTTEGRFAFYSGAQVDRTAMDPWAAGVALYELLAGRLPFPITRHSLAKMWVGIPMPLGTRRQDVPPEISQLVNDLISGDVTMSRVALRAELERLRPRAEAKIANVPAVPVVTKTEVSPVHPHVPEIRVRQPAAVPPKPGRANLPPPPPIDWRLEASAPMRCPVADLTAAVTRAEEIVAASKDTVARYQRGQWSVEPARSYGLGVRKIVPIGKTDYLAISGDHRLLRLKQSGGFVPWGPRLDRFALHGIVPLGDGKDSAYIVGGSMNGGRAMIAKLDGERVKIIADNLSVSTFYAATIMPDGSFFAVGAQGGVTRLRGGAVIETANPCAVGLFVVGAAGDEVLVAGDGAYAFRVKAAPLSIEIEPVDTTSSLTCLTIDPAGGAWLGGTRGRILRRREKHWRRMSGDIAGRPDVLAIQALPTQMRAILADGTVVLGSPVKPKS